MQAELLLNPPEARWLESVWALLQRKGDHCSSWFVCLFFKTPGASFCACSLYDCVLHVPPGKQVTLLALPRALVSENPAKGATEGKGRLFFSDAEEKWVSQMFGKRKIKLGGKQRCSWEMVVTKEYNYSGKAS